MPKRSSNPDYEFSQKTNRQVKSGKLRQRENHQRLTENLGRLKQVQGCPWPEKSKERPVELLRETFLVNVALPDDLSSVAARLSSLPYPADISQKKRV